MKKTSVTNAVADMVKCFLLDDEIMTDDVKKHIRKCLEINCHLTSCYSLQVEEVQDIKGRDSKTSGWYIKLRGTRCGYNFFVNNDMKVVRKPNKNTVEVKYTYGLYNHNNFDECFWSTQF